MGKIKKKLNNKYFLITGAAGLLGYQHAIALLQIDYNLILTDLDKPKKISAVEPKACIISIGPLGNAA